MENYSEQQAQLQLDLEELEYVVSIVKMPRVIFLLSFQIHWIKLKLLKLGRQSLIPGEKAPPVTTKILLSTTNRRE